MVPIGNLGALRKPPERQPEPAPEQQPSVEDLASGLDSLALASQQMAPAPAPDSQYTPGLLTQGV